jgi:Cu(I)/Ag(I) efflux system membrane fusion protein
MRRTWIAVAASALVGVAAGALLFRNPAPPAAKPGERKVLYYRDPMNPQITSPTPRKSSDGMDYVPVYEEGGGAEGGDGAKRGIRVDPRMMQASGVRIEEVKARPMSRMIRTVGQVTYDERLLFNMNAKFMGWVEKLYVDYTGKAVRKGEPLMEIYSPDLVSTQEEYLLALRHRKGLQASDIPEARAGADELVRSARQRLSLFDIPPHEVADLERRGAPKKTLMLHSPATGTVIEKSVFEGTQVTPGAPLFKIADLSNVWVLADVYQYELAWVKPGMTAEVELSYLPGKSFAGKITYIYPYLSLETRTVKVRVEVAHRRGQAELKPDMFATVVIRSPEAREAVAVPEQAIIHSGTRNIAVMALGGGYFEPREVQLGVAAEGYVEVREGIRVGEQIVTGSQFLIDAESNLRSASAAMGGHEGMAMPAKPTAPAQPADVGHAGHDAGVPAPPPAEKGMSGGHEGMRMEDGKRP